MTLTTIATSLTVIFGILGTIGAIFHVLPREINTALRKFAAPAFIVSLSLLIGTLLENITDNIATPVTIVGFVLAIIYMIWDTLSQRHQISAFNARFYPASSLVSAVCIAVSGIAVGVLLEQYDDNTTLIFSLVGCFLALVYIAVTIWASRYAKLASDPKDCPPVSQVSGCDEK